MAYQRIWAAVTAVWAVMAVFTLLALRQTPVPLTGAPAGTTTTHATTSSSTVAAGQSGQSQLVAANAITRSS